jgi:hypothetical protein
MDDDGGAADDTYLVGHLHEALLADSRLHEQGLEIVVVSTRRIAVHGEVATEARREAVLDVIHSLVPDLDVLDDLRVSPLGTDVQTERL